MLFVSWAWNVDRIESSFEYKNLYVYKDMYERNGKQLGHQYITQHQKCTKFKY